MKFELFKKRSEQKNKHVLNVSEQKKVGRDFLMELVGRNYFCRVFLTYVGGMCVLIGINMFLISLLQRLRTREEMMEKEEGGRQGNRGDHRGDLGEERRGWYGRVG